jgi:hypothetical protein
LAWREIHLSDVSDVCVDAGTVWLLSDQQRCMQTLDGQRRPLPKGVEKPEGLARTPEGTWLVTVDNRDGRDAILVLES